VPHVASETKAMAARHASPHLSRAADRPPSQQFANLLDDQPATASPQPTRSAQQDSTPRPERSQASQSKTDSKDTKPAEKVADGDKSNATADTKASGTTTRTTKEVSDTKSSKGKVESDTGDQPKPDGDSKPAADTAKSDGPASKDGSGAPLPTTNAVAADVGVAVTTVPQDQTAPTQGAPAVQVGPTPTLPQLVALQIGNSKADGQTKVQDAKPDDAAPTQDAKPPAPTDDGAKPPAPTDDGAKPQSPVNDANKPAPTAAKGDGPPPQHHAASTDVLPASTPDGNAAAAASKAASSNQPVTPPTPVAQAAATPAANQTAAAQPAAVPLAGVAIEIAGRAIAGKNRFEIRLDPPELGRIDVRLDVDRNGHVTSHLTVDRPETLNLLRQDSAGLERALQDAGLKTSDNGLQFSLRDQTMGQDQPQAPNPRALQVVVDDDSLTSTTAIPQRSRIAGMGGGLDIRV
jgi:flagellar hook-length control protein FliK